MTDALRLEVKKDGFAQLQSGSYKLTVTLNPSDLDDNSQSLLLDFIRAPMGAVYMLGMARVDMDTGEAAKTHTAASEKPRERFHDKPYSVQAALRCQDARFASFLEERHEAAWKAKSHIKQQDWRAACFVREYCGVESRRELDSLLTPYNGARERWQALNAEFEEWAGLQPEERG